MANHYNWQNKAERAEKAKQHTVSVQKNYQSEIEHSVSATKIYGHPDDIPAKKQMVVTGSPEIIVADHDSVSAAYQHEYGKTCILNFASYKNPGGMFLNGSRAQEECLCHESTLYNVLSQFDSQYYEYNRKHLNNALYLDRALYSPDVLFRHNNINKTFDVLTCAAPNIAAARRYRYIDEQQHQALLKNRIRFMFDILDENEVDTMILGAWGCGVFGQNPYAIAKLMQDGISDVFAYSDKKFIFAIPASDRDKNFIAFKEVFDT